MNKTAAKDGEVDPFAAYCDSETEAHDVFIFLFIALLLGTCIKHITMMPAFRNVQDTVVIFLLGLTYSLAQEYLELYTWTGPIGASHCIWMGVDPHVLLFAMLPVLLTGDAMAIDTAVARQVAKQAIFLAGPGVVFASFVTAAFLYGYLPYDWSFQLCLTVGSIFSATDPVAVVCLLKELGAPPNLTVLIQGESLLNDGTSIVLFRVAYDLLSGGTWKFDDVALFLLKVVVGAAALGYLIGMICVAWLRSSCKRLEHESPIVQVSITLLCAYWSYIAAEGFLGLSGVLATVCSALVLADRMWPLLVQQEVMNHAWHIFEYVGNTIIFFLAGALTGHAMLNIPGQDYLHLVVIYILCTVVRGLMLLLSAPFLRMLHANHEPVHVPELAVMCWGGLRGAVGLSLAIEVSIDRAEGKISSLDGHRVLFFTSGIAALTLLVNATTCPALVKRLGVVSTSKTRLQMMLTMHRQLGQTASLAEASVRPSQSRSEVLSELGNSVSTLVSDMMKDVELHIRSCTNLTSTSAPGKPGGMFPARRLATEFVARGSMQSVNSNTPMRSVDLVCRYNAARDRFGEVSEDTLGLLRLPPGPAVDDMEAIEEMVSRESVTQARMRVVNEAFLSLLRTQYWTFIREGEFNNDESSLCLLLNSVGFGLENSAQHLADLQLVAQRLVMEGEEDEGTAEVGRMGLTLLGRGGVDGNQPDGGSMAVRTLSTLRSPKHRARTQKIKRCNLIMVMVVCFNILWICLEFLLQAEFVNTMGPFPVIAVDALFEVLFLIEFAYRFQQFGWDYFQSGLSTLDVVLLMICMVGTGMEFVIQLAGNGEVAEWLRMVRLFRVVRAVWAVNVAWRFAAHARACSSDADIGRVHHLTTLVCLAQAHVECQRKLVDHFGNDGHVQSSEEARCIMESQLEVYVAGLMACQLARLVDDAALEALFILKESSRVTGELSKRVIEAHEAGLLTVRDTEALLHPMKEHISAIDGQLLHTLRGKLDSVCSRERGPVWSRSSVNDRRSCDGCQDFEEVPAPPPVKCPQTLDEDAALDLLWLPPVGARPPAAAVAPVAPVAAVAAGAEGGGAGGDGQTSPPPWACCFAADTASTPRGGAAAPPSAAPAVPPKRSLWVQGLRERLSQHKAVPPAGRTAPPPEAPAPPPGAAAGQPKLPTPPESLVSSPRSIS